MVWQSAGCRYEEKGRSYIRSIDAVSGDEAELRLLWNWLIHNDMLIWVGDAPGLVYTAAIPSLAPLPPLPFRDPSFLFARKLKLSLLSDGRLGVLDASSQPSHLETLALPSPPQRDLSSQSNVPALAGLLDAIEGRVFSGIVRPPDSRLTIEACAFAFLAQDPWQSKWQPSPFWLPYYWHGNLIARGHHSEAERLLNTLDAIASPLAEAEPEQGWDRAWAPQEAWIELAIRYVRRQARILAAACRAGAMPSGVCILFDPAPDSSLPGSRVDPNRLTPALRGVFEHLVRQSG